MMHRFDSDTSLIDERKRHLSTGDEHFDPASINVIDEQTEEHQQQLIDAMPHSKSNNDVYNVRLGL